MAEMYVRLILRGKRCFAEVPEHIKDEVKRLLVQIQREDLLED